MGNVKVEEVKRGRGRPRLDAHTTVPGDAGNRRFCLLGSIPSPLNRPLRWSGYGSASLTDFENGGSSKRGKDDRPLQNPSLNYNGRKSD